MSFISCIDSLETSGCARADSCALAVIGAGPHALSIVTRLLASDMKDTDGANEADKVRSTFWSRRLGSMTSTLTNSSTHQKGSRRHDKPNARRSILNHVRVFDPSGTWMHTWNSLFSALEIPHLRSPSFVTPDPFDSQLACRAYAARHGLEQARHFKPLDALFPTVVGSAEKSGQRHLTHASAPPDTASIKGGVSHPGVSDADAVGGKGRQAAGKSKAKGARILRLNEVSRDSFALPSTPLFHGLCSELVSSHGLFSSVTPAAVTRIIPLWNDELPGGISSWDSPGASLALQTAISGPQCRSPRSSPPSRFALLRSDDSVTVAERVVIATGSQGKPRIPAWVQQAVVAQGVCPPSSPATVDWPALLRETFRSSLLHTCQLPSFQPQAPPGATWKADAAADVHTAETGWLRPHLAGKHIVIVGGGLTSAHLVLVALAAGCASVTLVVRRDTMLVKQFDLGLSWMTRARPALQYQYWCLSPEERVRNMRAARGGGSVSPEVHQRLLQAVKDSKGRARIMTGMEVCQAEYAGDPVSPSTAWTLSVQRTTSCGGTGPMRAMGCEGGSMQVSADLVILATGCAVDVRDESLFADLLASCPPPSDPLAGGLPLLDAELRWSPSVPVYLCGVWAAHQLGPDALNLMGGQNAAKRLWPVLRPWLDGVVEGKEQEDVCDDCDEEAVKKSADTSMEGEEDGASTMDAASSTACEGECCTHEAPLTWLTPRPSRREGTAVGPKMEEQDARVQSTLSRFLGGDGNMFSILGMDMDSDCDD